MFTGIVQNLGNIINYTNGKLKISTSLDLSDCKIGSSICCNGVCLTATEINFRDKIIHSSNKKTIDMFYSNRLGNTSTYYFLIKQFCQLFG